MDTTLISDVNKRRKALRLYESYYRGDQKTTFMGSALQGEFGKKVSNLSANRCGPIIDAALDRLEIVSFEDSASESDYEAQISEYWNEQNLDLVAVQLHREVMVQGDAYALVWPTEDGPRIYPQMGENCAVAYSDEDPDTAECGLKMWKLRDGRWRANYYYRDRLEKYISRGASEQPPDVETQWEHYSDGDEAWPVVCNFPRVPLFHFRVNAKSGCFGHSDLADIIPLQDRLNQTIASQAIIEEAHSYPQRWVIGLQINLDPETGKPIPPFVSGADKLWAAGEGVQFGQFDATDLTQFETMAQGTEARIARTARIPPYYLTQDGTPPSGESLKTVEASFIAKVKARQQQIGATWNAIANFVLHLLGEEGTRVRVVWRNPESRSAESDAKIALMKLSLGVSPQQSMRELGYSEDQLIEFTDEIAEWERLKQARFDEGSAA